MLSVELKGLDKALLLYDEKKVRRAARKTINDGLTRGRKIASKEIRTYWKIKPARVNKELTKFKAASNTSLVAIIQAKGRPIGLTNFGTPKARRGKRLKSGQWSKSAGVKVTIRPGRRTRLPHAFIATGAGGNRHVFERSGRGRYPIKNRATITIASMFDQGRVMAPTLRAIQARLDERFDHHLNYELAR